MNVFSMMMAPLGSKQICWNNYYTKVLLTDYTY